MIQDFVEFLLRKTWFSTDLSSILDLAERALSDSVTDWRYYEHDVTYEKVFDAITGNTGALASFLYRLGRLVAEETGSLDSDPSRAIHWLMRETCACEIYLSNNIGVGFRVVHGVGTVIGLRNRIGSGFTVYHGCTIGHKSRGGKGCDIGTDFTMYARASAIGELRVGNRVTLGAHALLLSDVPDDTICVGVPAKAC